MRRYYGEPSRREVLNPRKWKVGVRAIGCRGEHHMLGTVVKNEMVDANGNGWFNPSYSIKCDKDGKVRKFQMLISADRIHEKWVKL